jgi:hypothetical protein
MGHKKLRFVCVYKYPYKYCLISPYPYSYGFELRYAGRCCRMELVLKDDTKVKLASKEVALKVFLETSPGL